MVKTYFPYGIALFLFSIAVSNYAQSDQLFDEAQIWTGAVQEQGKSYLDLEYEIEEQENWLHYKTSAEDAVERQKATDNLIKALDRRIEEAAARSATEADIVRLAAVVKLADRAYTLYNAQKTSNGINNAQRKSSSTENGDHANDESNESIMYGSSKEEMENGFARMRALETKIAWMEENEQSYLLSDLPEDSMAEYEQIYFEAELLYQSFGETYGDTLERSWGTQMIPKFNRTPDMPARWLLPKGKTVPLYVDSSVYGLKVLLNPRPASDATLFGKGSRDEIRGRMQDRWEAVRTKRFGKDSQWQGYYDDLFSDPCRTEPCWKPR